MKTMTCQDLGGPCDLALRADSADEIIKAQDRHLKEAVADGNTSHADARRAMQGRWRHPKKSMDWYNATKKTFADLPDE
jgi:predicted small metal-binding protein